MPSSPPPTTGKLRLLGDFVLELPDGVLGAGAWKRRRPAELLKLLGSAPGGRMRRAEVIAALWPDKDARGGANNLHRAVHDLRKVAGEGIVTIDQGVLHLPDSLAVDVRDFERGLEGGEPQALARSTALYVGHLSVEDSEVEALSARRRQLQQRFDDAVLKLARHRITVGDEAAAIDGLRRAVELSPASEEAHRLLMRALSAAGRDRDALSQYGRCVEALSQFLDCTPGAATDELRDAIAARLQAAPPEVPVVERVLRRLVGSAEPPPMHGRRAELDEVRVRVEALLATAPGEREGGVLLITGEAGAGKTRLVAEVVRQAGGGGALVLAGSTEDLGVRLPFAPFAEAWIEYRKAAGRASDRDPFASFSPTRDQPQEDMLRLFLAVERALLDATAERPVVLVIEDLHWADDSSLQLLRHLVRVCRSAPLLLVATCRQEELRTGTLLHTLVSGLGREPQAVRIVLRSLSPEATSSQLRDLLGERFEPALAERIFALSGGNAFFTEEVALSDTRDRLQEALDGSRSLGLSEVVRERVARLGDDAERLLRAASIVGREFAFECARAVCGLERDAAVAAVEAALSAWLLEETAEGYRFRHALVRSEIYTALSRERRLAGHDAAADFLLGREDAGDAAQRGLLVHHLYEAKRYREAIPRLMQAGEHAIERVGFPEARVHFERALQAMELSGHGATAARRACHQQLGRVHAALSNTADAIEHFERARAAAREVSGDAAAGDSAEFDRRIADVLLAAGDLDGAQERIERALDGSFSDAQRLSLMQSQAELRWCQERYDDARDIGQRILELAEASGDDEGLSRGYEVMAMACHSLGEWQRGMDYLERRRALVGDAINLAKTFEAHL